jgi:hypothetical protein
VQDDTINPSKNITSNLEGKEDYLRRRRQNGDTRSQRMESGDKEVLLLWPC